MDRFSFGLDIRPDTRMRIKSTLGNVQAGRGPGQRRGRALTCSPRGAQTAGGVAVACHVASMAKPSRLPGRPSSASPWLAASPPLLRIQAVDCTLPEGHPYRQACGLREGSSTSLVGLGGRSAAVPAAQEHCGSPSEGCMENKWRCCACFERAVHGNNELFCPMWSA